MLLKGPVRPSGDWLVKVLRFFIAVPAALLYAKDIFRPTAGFAKSSRVIRVTADLRKEIEQWRFLDSWEGCLP